MPAFVRAEVSVDYGQIYLESGGGSGNDLHECFAGQSNGLCGAAIPGRLFLITGLESGCVDFATQVCPGPPPLEDAWEEVVEVSYAPLSTDVSLVEWGGGVAWKLGLEENRYRVRYCASGMDEGAPSPERYLLQFWPAPPEPDRVVRQTGEAAAYWHEFVAGLPTPPSPWEQAEAERRAREEAERQVRAERLADERLHWGGLPAGDLLVEAGGHAYAVASLDLDLAEALARATPVTQRSVARWATRRAYAVAGLDDIDWIAPALRAMEEGADLPPPFDAHDAVWERLFADPRVPSTTVVLPGPGVPNFLQQAAAVPTIFDAVDPDPLQAALGALHSAAAAFGHDGYRDLFADTRATFRL